MELIKNYNTKKIYKTILLGLLVVSFFYSCTPQSKVQKEANSLKINFDQSLLNEDGLYGPKDGLRALDYEFCIPAEESKVAEVQKIDPSVRISKKAKGRIGCSKNEYLCIGSTNQKKWNVVLKKLATLDYVKRIDQVFYE